MSLFQVNQKINLIPLKNKSYHATILFPFLLIALKKFVRDLISWKNKH